ncbi:cytotoxic T-lymphocyte protein 4 [Cheilinus undulatus]|uniref:cytotoxic T-lymphocyte protein 4 n=1 Tax=Cheilinus undulatus TaxID=241271 RepID=UPI001BD44574|nr:cytotoxic T-lymphocyte protein 4 [Cheilinus undulatus]
MRHCRIFPTHCVTVWSLCTILSFCQPVWSALEVVQPYKVVSSNGTAQVRCYAQPSPFLSSRSSYSSLPDPEELRVTLLRGLHGTEAFCWSKLNLTEQRGTGVGKQAQVQCSAQLGEGAVEVTVSGLKASDTDLYRCHIEVLFPPPYQRFTGNGTLVHVLESSECPEQVPQRQTALRGDEDEDNERPSSVSVPVVVLVILIILALLFVLYLQALQCRQGRREINRPVSHVVYKGDAAFPCQNISTLSGQV